MCMHGACSLCRLPAGSFDYWSREADRALIDPAIPTQSGQTILPEAQRGTRAKAPCSMHADASPPPDGGSDCTARGRDRVTEKLVTHPAPCLPKASRALSELCRLRFLWQKVKLGRGLLPSCWNHKAHRNYPWFNRFRLLGGKQLVRIDLHLSLHLSIVLWILSVSVDTTHNQCEMITQSQGQQSFKRH